MKNHEKKNGKRHVLRYIFLGGITLSLLFVLFGAVYVFNLDEWKSFDEDKILQADQTLLIYDKDCIEVAGLYKTENRIWTPLAKIPILVQKAFISAEDARFYEHIGLDFKRILAAAWYDLKVGSYAQGASTITQQLIKLSHLSPDKKMQRKIGEAVMAYQMERRFDKDEILEMYMNYVYFGGGYYGVEAAARGYFGVSSGELTIAQGAMLAGILKAPSDYAPHLDLDASIKRRNLILSLMHDYGYLSLDEYTAAKSEPVNIIHGKTKKKRGYYVDTAISFACKQLDISMDELLCKGYRIYTAMDSSMQAYAEKIFSESEAFPAEGVEGALVVVDAKKGEVAALLGGRESDVAMGLNRAIDIRRQPGSVMKPIIAYAPAIEMFGYTAASMLLDEAESFDGYEPNNFGEKYNGWVTLRDAVTRSLNVPAVRVLSGIGVDSGKMFAKRLGIKFNERDDGLALALGGFTYGVSPYQIAGAYSTFAAKGLYKAPSFVRKITDNAGNILYENTDAPVRVMSEENAYILTSMLETAISVGTGRRLGESGIPLAGKTGTVGIDGGNRDAWMAAYNSEYCAAVWLGYDTAANGQALDKSVTGGTYPAMMLKQLFEHVYENSIAPDFSMPPGVKEFRIDKYTLENKHELALASALTPAKSVATEVFALGTEPSKQSEYWTVPTPPTDVSVQPYFDRKPYIRFTPTSEFIIYKLYRDDEEGNSKLINEFSAVTNVVEYHDVSAQYGKKYSYYVSPCHPSLMIDDKQVIGVASQKVEISVGMWLEAP